MKKFKLWYGFIAVTLFSFAVLLYVGTEIYHSKPPVPGKVITTEGTVIFTGQQIRDGQNVWQSIGGQEVGTIWGHGAYVAPDWSADWLHREAEFILQKWSKERYGKEMSNLTDEEKAVLQVDLKKELRTNTYDEKNGTLTVSPLRAEAIAHLCHHYKGIFMNDASKDDLRSAYSIPENSIKDTLRMQEMNAFFF